jgi:hypothetical protein
MEPRTILGVRALVIVAALSALLALGFAGCGGDSSEGGSAQSNGGGAEPEEHTPASCLGDAGVDSMSKPTPRTWRGVHASGYMIRVQQFRSPAAAHRAVEAATDGVAYQANFFGIFGPTRVRDDGATAKVARCLTGLP